MFDELSKLYENSATYENKRFAIRSSAIGEDSEDLSSAGQNETILGPILDGEKTESNFFSPVYFGPSLCARPASNYTYFPTESENWI